MAEGVGKRIVDALKMQSELEIIDKTQTEMSADMQPQDTLNTAAAESMPAENISGDSEAMNSDLQQSFTSASYSAPASVNSLNFGVSSHVSDFTNNDTPANVAVLKQLIAQLPNGVSRQAGALVIKQTMEALGISMKSVLQEAQQLQESLNLSARECQGAILECKKQISNLELQVQNYQKQANSLNEIISLFVQIN